MKKDVPIILICLILLFIWNGCKEKKIELGKDIHFDKEENIHYGNSPEQIMDLYIPTKKSQGEKDVFIIIHGGGWRSGNKSQLTFFTLSLMQKFPDHVFVNMNYRLVSETNYGLPNQMNDIKEVSAFLEKKLRYNPKFILLGNSAGGHLSMLYAYKFDTDKRIKAVINIVGPADLSDPGFKNYQEYSFVERRLVDPRASGLGISRIDFASPVKWINENSPPTLSYYGSSDRVIPSTQGKILDSTLNKNQVIHESYQFNGGHLDWDKQPNDQFLIDKIETFLKKADKK
ncbi:alpha/beta hydrolase [Chryseobacterium culicis]|uniref:Acetylesterase n=1 Tax=Chryseobacterium culicis TaxID=680127 RepID=A0A2S9CT28_CHRCI|nr:alpha/beta hydrolase [Chryseobacterium culicis]PRB83660.1 acetylesterase [Chryseobacterium culicis]PRB89902.1 acetylesterase [Chryseobacterium culicis]